MTAPIHTTHPLSLTRDLYDPALEQDTCWTCKKPAPTHLLDCAVGGLDASLADKYEYRPAWREPRHPGYLATDNELCAHWRAMDAHYSTDPGSPLHHDWRCDKHNNL